MKGVRVKYTVSEDFVDQNKANIAAVMQELRGREDIAVKYAAYLAPNGKTFRHVLLMRDDEARAQLTGLASFQAFQAALRPNLEAAPEVEDWALVGSNYDA